MSFYQSIGNHKHVFHVDHLPLKKETSFKPVVVIDPEDREQVERLVDLYEGKVGVTLQDDMQAALREFANGAEDEPEELPAGLVISSNGDLLNWRGENYVRQEVSNPTPPKPEEPKGLGAVVEDAEGSQWVRVNRRPFGAFRQATGDHKGLYRQYDNITAVRVLSEGVVPS